MHSVIERSGNLDLSVEKQLKMYNRMGSSIQMYASEVWWYNVIREIELLHTKFKKNMCCLYTGKQVMIYVMGN